LGSYGFTSKEEAQKYLTYVFVKAHTQLHPSVSRRLRGEKPKAKQDTGFNGIQTPAEIFDRYPLAEFRKSDLSRGT